MLEQNYNLSFEIIRPSSLQIQTFKIRLTTHKMSNEIQNQQKEMLRLLTWRLILLKNIYSKCYYTTVHSRLLLQEKNNEITINSTAGGNV